MIPIVFCSGYKKDQNLDKNEVVTGDFRANNKQSIIHIYSSWDMNIEDVKQRVRHEMIHYMLWCIGLPHGDDAAVFHHLCNMYDAHAYVDIEDSAQLKLLDLLNAGTKSDINAVYARFIMDKERCKV